MPHDPYKALYIHLPFCVSRCLYCDFTTQAVPDGDPQMTSYVEDLCLQIRRLAKQGELAELSTVYLGGGTPTHLGLNNLGQLLYMISLSVNVDALDEFSMEANPESLTERIVKDSWALGVNRLSIGVQSFDDDILRLLGRAHNAADAEAAITRAHERFDNVSIDLMCGIPGQSDDSLADSIHRAVQAGVRHISMYPLTVEAGTPLARAIRKRQFPPIDEDAEAHHMELAADLLQAAGFARYEVSNYALPGYESKHNSLYWQGVPYLGLGRSAVTMTQNSERRMRKQDGSVLDDLDPAQMKAEDLMLGMRMSRGVSDLDIEQAQSLLPGVSACFQGLIDLGLVEHTEGRYRPTKLGWLCGNELYGRIFDLA